jgi:hypothetical protein
MMSYLGAESNSAAGGLEQKRSVPRAAFRCATALFTSGEVRHG